MFVRIPEGWFRMGGSSFPWEQPLRRVWIDEFEVACATVTRAEYAEFLAETGHIEPAGWRDPTLSAPDQPVVGVNWFDAVSYCEWLSGARGEAYRLPAEAEWEKACRGGLESCEYAWGNDPPESFEYFRGEWKAPRPAGKFPSNGYGLMNIGDNVHEWCLDWYAEDYYQVSPERNPRGPETGTRRVSRGGSWRHQIKASRAAHRSSLPPEYRYTDYGFRIVRGGVLVSPFYSRPVGIIPPCVGIAFQSDYG
jgi:formylglycine-generating enzyme required for sulfatase activity